MHRNQAISLGLTRYRSDKPCRKGHISDRYTSTGNCIACLSSGRKLLEQVRSGKAQGWPTVVMHVPRDTLPTLRIVVDLLRRHGDQAEYLRGRLREGVAELLALDPHPVADCLIVTGGFERAPVQPIEPGPDPDDEMPGWHGDSTRAAPHAPGPVAAPALPGSVVSMIPAAFRGQS